MLAGSRRQLLGWCASQAWATGALASTHGRTYRVAELQIVQHPALNADARGFSKGLAAAGFEEGRNLQVTRFDGEGDPRRVANLARHISTASFDLVHTIATTSSQAVQRLSTRVPQVFSSVTDPIFAGIVPPESGIGQRTRRNITGVSDHWPVDLQLHVYASIVPSAQVWGTVYNPQEPNSIAHLQQMRRAAQARGLQLIEAFAHHPNEVRHAAITLAAKVDAFTITADNTAVSRLQDLVAVCNHYRRPLFAGDIDSVDRGAAAAYGLDYHLVGYAAGRKAALILKGIQAGDIAWNAMEKFSLVLNPDAALQQGITFSTALQSRAHRLVSARL